ncbi:RHS repeat protein [Salmonella enterica subsp. salamae]|nr:RHS repeat protein [Salmonella enterica subsp. salamae serovar 56:z10:e,n,x]ECE6398448.1 RHS repeat protein [Salmonella enterica subsp. salamae]ECJ2337596.1 RHS repeat protein [Salmonella enterica subsp. salamae]HCM2051201.1 RHS repeat protein [Salmonella enterica subsp. salamae serovar 56:z10:e,n,x]
MLRQPETSWYGWNGDRLTTTQTDDTRIQTVYPPGSFTPLIRTETATEELAKTYHRSLAEKLQQDAGMAFVPELVALLDNLERELNAGRVSEQSRQWLAQCGLTPEQMKNQMAPAYTPARKIHLYHCDHRGLPLALIDVKGRIAWRAEFDEWGNVLLEDNPDNLQQLIRLPGQQYDEESGLHYNRHRYYDPGQGRYITQDPTGLMGGWNLYKYPLNPVSGIDPLGLSGMDSLNLFLSQPGLKSELMNVMSSEPWYMNEGAYSILSKTHNDMKRLNLADSDQFFHCSAFCRVSKSRAASGLYATFLGGLKEKRDAFLNNFGLYGKGGLSPYDMAMDNAADLKVNMHGITCPSEQSCPDRCKQYINPTHKNTINVLIEEGYLE